MAASDFVETETPVFTEEDVYMLTGYLAQKWRGYDTDDDDEVHEVIADTEEAIMTVLSRGR